MDLRGVKLVCFMPCYDKAGTIAKAIESVLAQRADFAYKLIIIDDCSSDDSYQIASQFRKKHPREIILLKNSRNLGQLESMNQNAYPLLKGIPYFCVLDPDDYYIYDKKFADAVAFLESHSNFSAYSANIEIEYIDGVCKKFYNGNAQIVDFDFESYKRGKVIFVQTSGSIFRNIYFYDGISEDYKRAMKMPYAELFSADGFRNPWHLKGGKFRFVNRVESVWNYNYKGEWSSLPKCVQSLLNAELNLAFSDFFSKSDEQFFLREAKNIFDCAVVEFRQNRDLIAEHKDKIFEIFKETYMNPKLENLFKKPRIHRKNNLLENIFSVRKSNDKRHKIITIFGIKIRIKRKKSSA